MQISACDTDRFSLSLSLSLPLTLSPRTWARIIRAAKRNDLLSQQVTLARVNCEGFVTAARCPAAVSNAARRGWILHNDSALWQVRNRVDRDFRWKISPSSSNVTPYFLLFRMSTVPNTATNITIISRPMIVSHFPMNSRWYRRRRRWTIVSARSYTSRCSDDGTRSLILVLDREFE